MKLGDTVCVTAESGGIELVMEVVGFEDEMVVKLKLVSARQKYGSLLRPGKREKRG